MVKNEKLLANIITPATNAADHDVPVTPEEITTQEAWFREVPLRKSKVCMPTFLAHYAHDSATMRDRPIQEKPMITVTAFDEVSEASVREEPCESSEIAIAYSSVSTPISGNM
nr:phosphoribosylaminoimidazole-succinocarboxamide synthase, chloroplastic [Tanacetum cinerariifolium]